MSERKTPPPPERFAPREGDYQATSSDRHLDLIRANYRSYSSTATLVRPSDFVTTTGVVGRSRERETDLVTLQFFGKTKTAHTETCLVLVQ